MNTSFFRRQSTWVCILLAGLVIIIAGAYISGHSLKHVSHLPLFDDNDYSDYNDYSDKDTSCIVLSGFNFGFEAVSKLDGLPDGWGRWGNPSYHFVLDSAVKYAGKYALRIESPTDGPVPGFGCPHLSIPVNFTGTTVTLKAFMKLENVEHSVGLLLRIDGKPNEILRYENMEQHGITGTRDWEEYTITVPLPESAKTIHIGAIHSGPGKLWVDDFQVLIHQTKDYNLGFEQVSNPNELPDNWSKWGTSSYNVQVDSVVKRSGKYALRIESKDQAAAEGFSCPALSLPATFEGKEITVKAFMRTEGVEQPIGLMLRLDAQLHESLQFDNMMQKGIKGSEKWEEYSVTLPLSEETKTIYIGAILSGKGKLWVDDFQLLIDGKDIAFAKQKPKKTYQAEQDNEFRFGSKITVTTYTPQTVANLELLGRIWGFLKYYHPAVAKGDYNWDAELFRIMPSIINVSNTDERNKIFVEWIDRLGKVTAGKAPSVKKADIKLQPDFTWMEKPELGKTLSNKLKAVKNASREKEHYYISVNQSAGYYSFTNVGNPVFKNERPYEQMNYTDDSGMRLLALYRYWNMIEYFFPYKHLTDRNWNSVLGEFIPVFLDGTTELAYKQALVQLMAHVNDTYSNIFSDRALDAWKGVNSSPYQISFVEGKAVVTGFRNGDPEIPADLKRGDIITHIGEKTVEQFVEERKPYIPASNISVQMYNIEYELLRTNDDKMSLQIIRNGLSQKIDIACWPRTRIRSLNSSPKASYRLLSPEIGYIWPETLQNDSISCIMEQFKETKGIIIDFRCDPPSDFTVLTLGDWLTPQPVDFVKFAVGSIEQPGMFTFTESLQVGDKNEPYYKGKVVIIVNEETQRSAEYLTMAFQTAPHATVIGSTTGASDGNLSSIMLPGLVPTMVTGSGVYYPDGRETQRVGIKVDVEVKPTLQGILEDRDELLEKAIEIINN